MRPEEWNSRCTLITNSLDWLTPVEGFFYSVKIIMRNFSGECRFTGNIKLVYAP
jgi:hypothetical protein